MVDSRLRTDHALRSVAGFRPLYSTRRSMYADSDLSYCQFEYSHGLLQGTRTINVNHSIFMRRSFPASKPWEFKLILDRFAPVSENAFLEGGENVIRGD